jgi:hypothetical protein
MYILLDLQYIFYNYSTVGIATRLCAGWPRSRVSISGRGKRLLEHFPYSEKNKRKLTRTACYLCGCVGSRKLLLALARTIILGSEPWETHAHIFLSHDSSTHAIPLLSVSVCFQSSPVYCSWPSPAYLFLVSGFVGTHDQIFVRSKTVYIFRNGVFSSTKGGVSLSEKAPYLLHQRSCIHTASR